MRGSSVNCFITFPVSFDSHLNKRISTNPNSSPKKQIKYIIKVALPLTTEHHKTYNRKRKNYYIGCVLCIYSIKNLQSKISARSIKTLCSRAPTLACPKAKLHNQKLFLFTLQLKSFHVFITLELK